MEAVREVIKTHEGVGRLPGLALQNAHVIPAQVSSEISEQPMGIEETLRGAQNRAKNAFNAIEGCSLAFGLESGLYALQGLLYDVCICSVYTGSRHCLGFSSAFQIPPAVVRFVLEEGMDLAQAANAAKVSKNPRLGEAEGLIGILSGGRLTRQSYTAQAIETALIAAGEEWYC